MPIRQATFLSVLYLWIQLATGRECASCLAKIPLDPGRHKTVYTVGVVARRGIETVFSSFHKTFAEYLTVTAGQRFDPPISFQVVELEYQSLVQETLPMDFAFLSPTSYACGAARFGLQSLATITVPTMVNGQEYDLAEFGGLIIVHANNSEIETITDLKDKIIAASAITGFGSGLMQFYEMKKAGLFYINDPKQFVFTGDEGSVVKGVLDGRFDAGFVRTGLIGSVMNVTGQPIGMENFKVLNSRQDKTVGGTPFPYLHSTPLYPEWNFVALGSTPGDVSREAQSALFDLADHAKAGKAWQSCVDINQGDMTLCNDIPAFDPFARCDTTVEIANVSVAALSDGGYSGWRTSLSYVEAQELMRNTGIIHLDPKTQTMQCTFSWNVYDHIQCDDGFYKLPFDSFNTSCANAGIDCPDGYTCVCKPCYEAFSIEVAPRSNYTRGNSCEKMSICSTISQNEEIPFTIVDNLEYGLDLRVNVLEGSNERMVPVESNENHSYSFHLASTTVGVMVLEIFNGERQIDVSPLRVKVVYRDCPKGQRPNEKGSCICDSSTYPLFGTCVTRWVLLGLLLPVLIVGAVVLYFFVKKKNREANSLWLVNSQELEFEDPPVIIGRGSFGFVLMAEYRGSKVAVKRVLPPKKPNGRRFSQSRRGPQSELFGYEAKKVLKPEAVSPNNSTASTEDADIELGKKGRSSSVTRPTFAIEHSADNLVDELQSKNTGSSKSLKLYGESDDEMSISIDLNSNPDLKLRGMADDLNSSVSSMDNNSFRSTSFHDSIINDGVLNLHASTDSRIIDLNEDGLIKPNSSRKSPTEEKSLSKLKQEFIEEMRIVSKLRHPNITTVMGAVLEKGVDPMMIMEYMKHGSLQEVLSNPTMVLEAELILSILKDIASGVRFLHSSKPPVIHGDLKSQNILIDSKFRAKLSDFGFSNLKPEKATGTPLWMAPELLSGQSLNTTKTDMYSVGVIMYEIFARKEPYYDATESNQDLLKAIVDRKKNKRPRIPSYAPIKVKKLIKFLWHGEPNLRPTARELDNRLSEMDASYFEAAANATENAGEKPKLQGDNEQFLYQAFPRHVADVLKSGKKVEPESHDIVTIFFSDIVGFTTIAGQFEPLKVSQMLDRLYLRFDDLSRKHKLFKIETIGDAYMCAGNLATDQRDDHVKRIALFAKDAIKAASETLIDEDDPSFGHVQIRVGFHSGPVVSNVVGNLNPRYGVFGDTVNVASRMESNSEAGRIHCSKASAKLLMSQAPEIKVRLRGETEIKGKGVMTTYWVHP